MFKTKPAAGDDSATQSRWLEEDAVARPCQLERRRTLEVVVMLEHLRHTIPQEDAIGFSDVMDRRLVEAMFER